MCRHGITFRAADGSEFTVRPCRPPGGGRDIGNKKAFGIRPLVLPAVIPVTGLFADYVGARGAASPKREPFHPRGWRVVRRVVSLKFMGDALTSLFGEALNSFGILAAGSQKIVGFDCDTIR